MFRNFVLSSLACAVALAASVARADDYYWIGPSGSDYMTPANWSKGAPKGGEAAVPGKLDRAIFDPGDGQTLLVTNTTAAAKAIYLKDFHVLSGTLNFQCPRGGENSGEYTATIKAADDVTNTLYVAEGAVLNSYYRYYPTTSGKGIVMKTGKGTANLNCNSWAGTTSGYLVEEFIVAEGTLKLQNRNAQYVHHWRVRGGTVLDARNYSFLRGCEIFSIDAGGEVMLSELTAQYKFSGLEGAGEMFIQSSLGSPGVCLYLNGGPYRFTGTFSTSHTPWFRNYYPSASFPASESARHFPITASKMYDIFTAYYAGTAPEFDPGIGEFYLPPLMSEPGIPFVTKDTDGEPIALHANIYSGDGLAGSGFPNYNAVVVSGPGDWWPRSGTQCVTGRQIRVTGQVGVPSGVTLQFGNGTAAAADFTDYPFALTNLGTLAFANVTDLTLTNALPNAGTVTAKGSATLKAYRTAANNSVIKADGATLTLAGTSVHRSSASVAFANGGTLVLDGPGVEVSGNLATSGNARNPWHTELKAPTGIAASGQTDASLLAIRNGAAFHFGGTSTVMPNTLVEDGGKLFIRNSANWKGPSSGTRAITLDGASLEIPPCFTTYADNLLNSSNADNMRLYIGAKGGTIGAANSSRTGRYGSAMQVNFNIATTTSPDCGGTDGGLAVDCGVVFAPAKAWTFSGPVTLGDARFHVSKAWYNTAATAGEPFGSGDLVMNTGGWLSFGDKAETMDLRVASATGGKLRLNAHGRLSMDAYTDRATRSGPITLTVGASGSSTSALACGTFGALTLETSGDLAKMNDTFTVKVEGGVPLHADGRTKAPLFFQGGYYTDFLTCDANNCLANFDNYVNSLDGGVNSTAFVDTQDVFQLESGVTPVGALKFYLNGNATKNVKIAKGARLRIGNGTDPAIILFQLTRSSQTYLPFDGEGSVDFSASRGWFVYPNKYNGLYTSPVRLTTTITGSGGVVFSGVTANHATDDGASINADFSLEAANTWTGGTLIDMKSVLVKNKDAFSSGAVTVKGSRMAGGSVIFSCEGPFANDFTISRFGRAFCCNWNGEWIPTSMSWSAQSHGALEFETVGTRLTGTVTVADHSRISSLWPEDGAEVAIFEGEVKGAHLEIVDINPYDLVKTATTFPGKRHKFVFCADNHSLTGGVDVLNGATVVLRGANPSLGTGPVTLNDGTLRFENTEPIVFPNDLDGYGTIVAAGTAPVTFTGAGLEKLAGGLMTFQPGTTYDYPYGTNVTFVVGESGLDLGGRSVTVKDLRGSGRIENGVLTVTGEINPGGADAIGTLTFAPGALVSQDATYVCEVAKAGMDKLVLESAFDLSTLSLRTVQLNLASGVQEILTTTARSGEFAKVTLARENYKLSYTPTAAKLSVSTGLLVIVR